MNKWLTKILIIFLACSLNISCSHQKAADNSDSIESIYNKLCSIQNYDSPEWAAAFNAYEDLCVAGGIDLIMGQYCLHKDNIAINRIVEKHIINKIDGIDYDKLIDIAPSFSGTNYIESVMIQLVSTSMSLGMEEMAKVYRLQLDDKYTAILEDFILECLYVVPLAEHRNILPYFKGLDTYSEVCNEYLYKITDSLSYANEIFVEDMTLKMNTCGDQMKKEVEDVYNDFIGGFWANITNNLFRSEETTNERFKEIWDKHFHREKYANLYTSSFDSASYQLGLRRYSVFKAIGVVPDSVHYLLKEANLIPNDSIMRSTVEARTKSFAKDAGFVFVDVLTLPVGGKANILIGGSELVLALVLNKVFADPKEYFIGNQLSTLNNQLTEGINDYISAIEQSNASVIESIKSQL